MKKRIILFLALIFALSLTACNETKVKSISVEKQPNKLEYAIGDALDVSGGKIKVTYSDNTTKSVDMDKNTMTFSGFSSATPSESVSVTVKYLDHETSFNVRVVGDSLYYFRAALGALPTFNFALDAAAWTQAQIDAANNAYSIYNEMSEAQKSNVSQDEYAKMIRGVALASKNVLDALCGAVDINVNPTSFAALEAVLAGYEGILGKLAIIDDLDGDIKLYDEVTGSGYGALIRGSETIGAVLDKMDGVYSPAYELLNGVYGLSRTDLAVQTNATKARASLTLLKSYYDGDLIDFDGTLSLVKSIFATYVQIVGEASYLQSSTISAELTFLMTVSPVSAVSNAQTHITKLNEILEGDGIDPEMFMLNYMRLTTAKQEAQGNAYTFVRAYVTQISAALTTIYQEDFHFDLIDDADYYDVYYAYLIIAEKHKESTYLASSGFKTDFELFLNQVYFNAPYETQFDIAAFTSHYLDFISYYANNHLTGENKDIMIKLIEAAEQYIDLVLDYSWDKHEAFIANFESIYSEYEQIANPLTFVTYQLGLVRSGYIYRKHSQTMENIINAYMNAYWTLSWQIDSENQGYSVNYNYFLYQFVDAERKLQNFETNYADDAEMMYWLEIYVKAESAQYKDPCVERVELFKEIFGEARMNTYLDIAYDYGWGAAWQDNPSAFWQKVGPYYNDLFAHHNDMHEGYSIGLWNYKYFGLSIFGDYLYATLFNGKAELMTTYYNLIQYPYEYLTFYLMVGSNDNLPLFLASADAFFPTFEALTQQQQDEFIAAFGGFDIVQFIKDQMSVDTTEGKWLTALSPLMIDQRNRTYRIGMGNMDYGSFMYGQIEIREVVKDFTQVELDIVKEYFYVYNYDLGENQSMLDYFEDLYAEFMGDYADSDEFQQFLEDVLIYAYNYEIRNTMGESWTNEEIIEATETFYEKMADIDYGMRAYYMRHVGGNAMYFIADWYMQIKFGTIEDEQFRAAIYNLVETINSIRYDFYDYMAYAQSLGLDDISAQNPMFFNFMDNYFGYQNVKSLYEAAAALGDMEIFDNSAFMPFYEQITELCDKAVQDESVMTQEFTDLVYLLRSAIFDGYINTYKLYDAGFFIYYNRLVEEYYEDFDPETDLSEFEYQIYLNSKVNLIVITTPVFDWVEGGGIKPVFITLTPQEMYEKIGECEDDIMSMLDGDIDLDEISEFLDAYLPLLIIAGNGESLVDVPESEIDALLAVERAIDDPFVRMLIGNNYFSCYAQLIIDYYSQAYGFSSIQTDAMRNYVYAERHYVNYLAYMETEFENQAEGNFLFATVDAEVIYSLLSEEQKAEPIETFRDMLYPLANAIIEEDMTFNLFTIMALLCAVYDIKDSIQWGYFQEVLALMNVIDNLIARLDSDELAIYNGNLLIYDNKTFKGLYQATSIALNSVNNDKIDGFIVNYGEKDVSVEARAFYDEFLVLWYDSYFYNFNEARYKQALSALVDFIEASSLHHAINRTYDVLSTYIITNYAYELSLAEHGTLNGVLSDLNWALGNLTSVDSEEWFCMAYKSFLAQLDDVPDEDEAYLRDLLGEFLEIIEAYYNSVSSKYDN